MSRFLIIFFLLVSLMASGIAVFMNRDRHQMAQRLIWSEASQHRLEDEVAELKAERERLRNQLQNQTPPPALAMTAPPVPPSGAASLPDAAPIQSPSASSTPKQGMKAWAEMLKSPGMKEVMRQQHLSSIEQQYGGLITHFQFDEAEKADFKQILADQILTEQDLGLQLMSEDLTPEQRQAYEEQIAEAKKTSEAKIKEFLNSDADFQTYQQWEETKVERMQLDTGRGAFASVGEPLSPEQEAQLLNAMHQFNLQPVSTPALNRPGNTDPRNMTPADIEQHLARHDAQSQAVQQQAVQFLTPKQLEALTTSQQQWRTMIETGLKMSSMMFQQEVQK